MRLRSGVLFYPARYRSRFCNGLHSDGTLLLRRLLGRANRHQLALVSATFGVGTIPRGSLLSCLLEQERLAALRTRFLNWLVPENRVALRIVRAAIENFSTTRFFHHEFAATARPRTLHAGQFLFDVFALRIV